jgi:hypothetical protein
MVNSVIFVGGVFLTIVVYLALYIRINNNKRFQMIDWFLLSLSTFNGLGFTFVYLATSKGFNSSLWEQYVNLYDNSTATIYLISTFLLGLSALFGWTFFRVVKKHSITRKNDYYFAEDQLDTYIIKTKYLAWIMLFVSVISYALYSSAYGGFVGLAKYSMAIRSGVMIESNPYSYFEKFGGFSFFSSFIFFGLIIDKSVNKRKRKLCVLGCISAFIFSLYVLYSWAGRIGALIYIATFIFGYILYNYKSVTKLIKRLFLFTIALPPSLIGINSILCRSNENIGVIDLFAKELSFPFASFIVQFNQNNYRLFKDIFVAPLFIFPQRIWSGILNIEVASSYNTYIFFGTRKGVSGVTGSIPVDMLTFSYMQASIIGIVIVGFLWGGLLFYLETLCRKIHLNGVRQLIYANLVLNVAILSVLYGDPQHIVIRNFAIIVGIIFMMIIMKFKLGLGNELRKESFGLGVQRSK